MEPDILLLDEPTNDLDIPTLQWLEAFIADSRLPILYISHDETLIKNTANVIVHMEQVAQKQRDDYAKQMEKWQKIYNRVDHEQEVISRQTPGGGRLLKKKRHTVLSMDRRFEREKENFQDFPQEEEAILEKFDESIHLPSGKTVLDFSSDKLCRLLFPTNFLDANRRGRHLSNNL